MKTRILAAAVLAAAVVLSTSACTFLSRQATTISYDAADQVSVDLGSVQLRSLLVVTDDPAGDANLIVVAVNEGAATTLNIEYTDANGRPVRLERGLPAASTTSFGFDDHESIVLVSSGATPGALLDVYFQQGGHEGVLRQVPVLNTDWHQYENLAPLPTIAPVEEEGTEESTEEPAESDETPSEDEDAESGH